MSRHSCWFFMTRFPTKRHCCDGWFLNGIMWTWSPWSEAQEYTSRHYGFLLLILVLGWLPAAGAEGLWLWKLSCLIVVITKYCTGLECSVATNMYLNMVFKYFEQILFRIFIIKIKFNSKFRFKKIVNSVVKPCNTAWATGWRWASVICSR